MYRVQFFNIFAVMVGSYEAEASNDSEALQTVSRLLRANPIDPHNRVWRVEIWDGPDLAHAWFVPNENPDQQTIH